MNIASMKRPARSATLDMYSLKEDVYQILLLDTPIYQELLSLVIQNVKPAWQMFPSVLPATIIISSIIVALKSAPPLSTPTIPFFNVELVLSWT